MHQQICISCHGDSFLGRATPPPPAHLRVRAGRGQVLVSSAPFFAERDSRVQQLQPSPEAVQPLQHVLHAGLEILLDLEESQQRARPAQTEDDSFAVFVSPERVQPAGLTSAAGSCGSAALWLPSQGLRPHRRTPAERTQPAGWRHKQRDMSQCLSSALLTSTPQK